MGMELRTIIEAVEGDASDEALKNVAFGLLNPACNKY
jgi:hypothetical protein